ncbi:MAG: hypothetical protein H0W39_06405 [Sphingomonas sp.]|nr:hypothetical protein [Sphingomonas sp.]
MHRLSLIGLLAAAAATASCQAEQPEPAADANASEPAVNLPSVPRPQPAIDRPSLLAAVAEAASAASAGGGIPEGVRALDGQQFEVRIRFGCRGPATELSERWLGWSFDPEDRRIRVRAMPTISADEPLITRMGGDDFDAVEGFWIPRPWLLQSVCPAAAAVARPAGAQQPGQKPPAQGQASTVRRQQQPQQPQRQSAATGQGAQIPPEDSRGEPVPTAPRIGIAQFFTENDPRYRQRGTRAYEANHTLAEGKAISSQGYNLVLAGRLRAPAGRGVIQCVARGADTPPECIISAEFLRVWIEQPDTREVIAEWSGGG